MQPEKCQEVLQSQEMPIGGTLRGTYQDGIELFVASPFVGHCRTYSAGSSSSYFDFADGLPVSVAGFRHFLS